MNQLLKLSKRLISWFSSRSPKTKRLLVIAIIVLTIAKLFAVSVASDDGTQPTQNTLAIPTSIINPISTPTDTNETSPLYNVTKVVDGDTLAVDINGVNETIRLIGIDTPETVDPRKPVQCFGVEASTKAKELLSNKKIHLEADSSQGERDKYNRLLRYVLLEDGTSFNKLMISEGYAFEYTYNTPYKYQTEYQQAEKSARAVGNGLWANDTCAGNIETQPTSTPVPLTPTPTQSAAPIIPIVSINPTATPVQPTPTQAPKTPVSGCDCFSGNIYNCSDFSTHAEAQSCYETCGGVDNDVHHLDANHDGDACESLP